MTFLIYRTNEGVFNKFEAIYHLFYILKLGVTVSAINKLKCPDGLVPLTRQCVFSTVFEAVYCLFHILKLGITAYQAVTS